MALVLNLKPGDDVFIGDTPVTVQAIGGASATLSVGERTLSINSIDWRRITPDCEVRVSNHRHRDNPGTHIRIQFDAPGTRVLRGTAYRNPKKGQTQ